MKTLIIHHLEPMWQDGYKRYGTSFDDLQLRFIEFLDENHFDRVILTRFEEFGAGVDEGYYPELLDKITDFRCYAYGWDKECAEHAPEMFCDGGTHSEKVLIDDWMIGLRHAASVTISGAFDGECVEDLEIALRHLEIDFEREETLII